MHPLPPSQHTYDESIQDGRVIALFTTSNQPVVRSRSVLPLKYTASPKPTGPVSFSMLHVATFMLIQLLRVVCVRLILGYLINDTFRNA